MAQANSCFFSRGTKGTAGSGSSRIDGDGDGDMNGSMLNEISIQNFKCFERISLPLKNINILAGINGMGKSAIIQGLLLLRQSYLKDKMMRGLYLNGKYVQLGNAQDVLFEKAETEKISFGYISNQESHLFEYQYIPESDFLPADNKEIGAPTGAIFGNQFVYLSSYRIEPKALYSITNEEEISNREFGNNGEYAIQYLSLFGDKNVANPEVIIEDKLGCTLTNQTWVWLDRISPGVSPKVMLNTQLRTSELRYEFIEGKVKTNSYKSVNVGFGITYVLPLIVAILSAKEGDIIILENPEAHIHPAGQRMLGELIARAGQGGVQVIVETHSDHILNGVRLAVKQKKIAKENVQLAFFYKDDSDNYRHKYANPVILEDGRLDIWPEGFFDEWDKALYELM